MKLRGTGFCLGTPASAPECTFEAFFKWLSTQNDLQKSWPFGKDLSRTLSTAAFVHPGDVDVVMGFFISKRSADTSHFVEEVNGDIVVSSKHDGNNPRRELNLFAINPKTWRGIYSSYDGSYACSLFVKDLWQVYLGFVKRTRETIDPNYDRREEFSTRGHGTYDILTSTAAFEEHVKALQCLSEVRYRIYKAKAPNGAPITSTDIKSEFRCISLSAYKPNTPFFTWVKKFARQTRRPLRFRTGSPQFSVVGKNASGRNVTIPLEDFAEDYLQLHYSSLGTVKLSDLRNNAVMKDMINLIGTRTEFTHPT